MKILTESEYEELVTNLSEQVFAPLGSGAIELEEVEAAIENGNQEEFKERLKTVIGNKILFDHGLGEGPLDSQDTILLASIIEQSESSRNADKYWSDERSFSPTDARGRIRNADKVVAEAAAAVLFTDVQGDVYKRIRGITDS